MAESPDPRGRRRRGAGREVPPGTPTFELPGAIVTPGFVDAHTHFAMWALRRRRVQLAGAESRDEAVRRVAAAAPVQGWIVGQGWDANGWKDVPDRAALDAVQPAPVYLDSLDVHAAWVNSAGWLPRASPARLPIPSGAGSYGMPPGSRRACCSSGRSSSCCPSCPTLRRRAGCRTPRRTGGSPPLRDHGHSQCGERRRARRFRRLEHGDELRLRVLFHPPVASLPASLRKASGAGPARSGSDRRSEAVPGRQSR